MHATSWLTPKGRSAAAGPKRGNQRAFTLVELLVVVGVITVLALLALPVLAGTRPNAKLLQCCNNLRQWARALQIYSGENGDRLPRDGMSSLGIYPGTGTDGTPDDPNAWFNLLPPYLSLPRLSYYNQLPGGNTRAKFPFPGNTNTARIWHCPVAAMSDVDLASVVGGGYAGFFSYAMNLDLKKQTESLNFSYPQMPRLPSFARPASTVLFSDCAFNPRTEPFNSSPQYNSVNPANRWRAFATRHAGGGVISFLDGQARFFPASYVTSGGISSNEPLRPDIIWNAPYRALNP